MWLFSSLLITPVPLCEQTHRFFWGDVEFPSCRISLLLSLPLERTGCFTPGLVLRCRSFCRGSSWFSEGLTGDCPLPGPLVWQIQLRLDLFLFSQPSPLQVVHHIASACKSPFFQLVVHLEESARKFKPQAPSWGPLNLRETPYQFLESPACPHFLSHFHLLSPTLSHNQHHQLQGFCFSPGHGIQKPSELR